MRIPALLSMVVLAFLLGACASNLLPAPPPHYLISLEPPPSGHGAPLAVVLPLRVDDLRDVDDRTRVGEIHAPAGAVPGLGGAGGGPAVAVGAAIALFAPTFPTGRYLQVRDPAEVALAVERALESAWLKSGRPVTAGVGLEAGVRRFWIQPSWTTTCELSVELRLRDTTGAVLWQQTIDSRVEAFEGFFTSEAFERVAHRALDEFTTKAAAVFVSAP